LRNASAKAAASVAHTSGVHLATIYRWINAYRSNEMVSSLMRKSREDKGAVKVQPEVEAIIQHVITDYFLTTQKRSVVKAHREIALMCRAQKLKCPSESLLRKRINAIHVKDSAAARLGQAIGRKYDPIKGTVPYAEFPYSLIQIDHTVLDVLVVSDDRTHEVGRPCITMAIDVYSRMIAGYYVSFDTPGALATGIAIVNAILPKDALLARHNITAPYPAMGIPRAIHLDNAREFHGESLSKACQLYGIDIVFRKLKRPNYGGHIERLMGTIATELKALPGATFADHKHRKEYDSSAMASLTLEDLEAWLANLFCGAYHHRVHNGLGMTPVEKYTAGLLGDDTQPGIGAIRIAQDPDQIRIDFLPVFERTIQPYGVSIDGIDYYADVLRRWIGASDPVKTTQKRKFIFRRDPRDISALFFYDPDARMHFKIPYRDATRPQMSVTDLRKVRASLADGGVNRASEDTVFAAYGKMRELEETSNVKTREARQAASKRRDNAKKSIFKSLQDPTAGAGISDQEDDLPTEIAPFDEIEPL
jgi:putative transposase